MQKTQNLNRSMSLSLLTFYGLGTIVGGGIYALLGKVAGEAGMAMPLAFALAGLIAVFSACSFAELSTRFPVSAGEAFYVLKGFNIPSLAAATGILVILTGIVSSATLVVATSRFFMDVFSFPASATIIILMLGMGLIAIWGINQSAIIIMLITVIEVAALVYICVINIETLQEVNVRWREIVFFGEGDTFYLFGGLLSGAFLAFYAFIGFEDMVNVAEEVKNVEVNMPKAIFFSVGLATLLYVLVSTIAVLLVPLEILSESNTPLTLLVANQPQYIFTGLWLVSILAGINGGLVQIIMASRVMYGMAKQSLLPRLISDKLATVSIKTHTPIIATAVAVLLSCGLALFFALETLAKITSTIVFLVFFLVNSALFNIKRHPEKIASSKGITFPIWVPLLGSLSALLMLLAQVAHWIG